MRFGVNDSTLAAFNKAGINPTMVRCYNPPTANVPVAFPGSSAKTTIAGGSQIVSIRPNIPDVLARKLDAQLKAYFASVPAGAYVTAWHEGEGARFNYTPAQILAMHDHLMDLFNGSAPIEAFYGQIFMSYSASPAGRGIKPFLAPGLDWYGIDAYGDGTNDPETVIAPALDQIWPAAFATEMLITESNTPNHVLCADWHRRAYRLARAYDFDAYIPYFGTGTGSQNYDASNTALHATLKEIAADSTH